MERSDLKPILEAMIFVAEEPITLKQLTPFFEESAVKKETIIEALKEIERDWNHNPERGLQLQEVAGGYQFRTKELCSSWLSRMSVPKPVKLSPAALETLAIIAYRQPIIRSEVESLRGVDSGGVMKTLLERRLIKIVGRRDEVGQPLIYSTTPEFLELFGLKDLNELPPLKDIEEFMRERKVMTEERTGDVQQELALSGEETPFDIEISTAVETILNEDSPSDEEALETLEESLRDLRTVEKSMSLKSILPKGESDGGEKPSDQTESRNEADQGETGSATEDETSEVDRQVH